MSAAYRSKLRPRKRKAPESHDNDDHIQDPPRRPRKRRRTRNSSAIIGDTKSTLPDSSSDQKIESQPTEISKSSARSQKAPSQHSPDIKFDVRSWGYLDSGPYKSHIKISNHKTSSGSLKSYGDPKKRGHRIVVIDGVTGAVEQTLTLDTWADIYSGIRLRIFLQTLQFKPNKWVIIVVHDSGYNINTKVSCC